MTYRAMRGVRYFPHSQIQIFRNSFIQEGTVILHTVQLVLDVTNMIIEMRPSQLLVL